MSPTRTISVSGVHGVGKSTIIGRIATMFHLLPSIKRPENPFLDPYEGMVFFVAAFSWRDKEIIKRNTDAMIDRWSAVDIGVYIDVLFRLRQISEHEHAALEKILANSASNRITPEIAILLDDEPSHIQRRIEKFREPSKHHILERNYSFIECLREEFLNQFEHRVYRRTRVIVVKVDGRNSDDVCDEVADWLRSSLPCQYGT